MSNRIFLLLTPTNPGNRIQSSCDELTGNWEYKLDSFIFYTWPEYKNKFSPRLVASPRITLIETRRETRKKHTSNFGKSLSFVAGCPFKAK
jgi:hypothetical protein